MATTPKLGLKTLDLLGLTEKDLAVYVAVLRLGNAPLRRVAEEAGLNRGTTYDALKRLIDAGLVSYVDANIHRYFTAEDPHKLRGLATRREVALQEARIAVETAIPALQEIAGRSKHRPAVRYFEGDSGVREILEDVLGAAERAETKEYRVYSSSDVRELIKRAWPKFTAERVARKIRVRAIAVGGGGIAAALSNRRMLATEKKLTGDVTYIFVYGTRTAYVSVDKQQRLFGVIIDDRDIAATQQLIFDSLWGFLPE